MYSIFVNSFLMQIVCNRYNYCCFPNQVRNFGRKPAPADTSESVNKWHSSTSLPYSQAIKSTSFVTTKFRHCNEKFLVKFTIQKASVLTTLVTLRTNIKDAKTQADSIVYSIRTRTLEPTV